MKQSSLLQSWARSSTPASVPSFQPKAQPNQTTAERITFIDDADDELLAKTLDSCEHVGKPTTPVDLEVLLSKIRTRPAVTYRPTGNDREQLPGFDTEAGRSWIFPLDANFREYQFSITEQCLFKNTLVCLPTGLGKTFIAAVLLYNFLRWYPTGKVVFMAPTRPLVTQQLAACIQFDAVSADSTVELTGSTAQSKRHRLWTTQRAFFLTPQVLANDLQAGVCPANDLRLLVFDEAHKATGNHSYCQVIRALTNPPHDHRQFRVIALSATPASDVQGVQTVIANLLISHLELRVETSADVKNYTQDRQLETIIVPLGPELNKFRDQLVNCVRTPLERLRLRGAIRAGFGDLRPDRIAKYTVVKARADWTNSSAASALPPVESGAVQSDFGLVTCLLHAIELLDQHGLRPLYQYLSGVLSGQRGSVRFELSRLPGVQALMSDLTARFHTGDSSLDFDSTQTPFRGGHPKLDKLKHLLVDHFNSVGAQSDTRVIVFSQFRDSVGEIMHMLKQLRPLIRPASFIGQSTYTNKSPVLMGSAAEKKSEKSPLPTSGISQRDQLRVMAAFRSGTYNTLVSTCVGEEGLDVGHVDLIVCFDAFKSPIRLMQRLGRTGRRRFGRIVMLLTEGREERNHAVSVSRTSSIHKALLEGGAYRKLAFYPHNPRMVPLSINPEVQFGKFETSSPYIANVNESKRRSSSKTSKPGACDEIRSHVDAMCVESLPIHFRTLAPSKFITLRPANEENEVQTTCDPPCLTQLYDLTSAAKLRATCECLQARLIENEPLGPSTSSRHLVSVLRLAQLYKAGSTQLLYHALGLRSIDTDNPLKEMLGELEEPEGGIEEGEDRNSKILTLDKPASPDFRLQELQCVTAPQMCTGIVSCQLFFCIDPDPLSMASVESLNALCTQLSLVRDSIDLKVLSDSWIDIIQSHSDTRQTTPPVDKGDVDPSMVCDLPEISTSIAPSQTPQKRGSNDNTWSVAAQSTPARASFASNLAAAFHVGLPAGHATDNLHKVRGIESPTQVTLGSALALLDRSSIRLDASGLLDTPELDSATKSHVSPPKVESAIFSGFQRSIQAQSVNTDLGFGTRLVLGEEFEDLLVPTQCPVMSAAPNGSVRHSSPCGSPHPSDSFPFPTDISWSPISVLSTDATDKSPCFDTVDAHGGARCHPNISTNKSPLTPHHVSPSDPQTSSSLHENCGQRRKRRHPRGHQYLMTQADVSGDDNSADEFENADGYEASFIDDHDSFGLNSTSKTETTIGKNDSSMLGFYLQSIRSPPVQPFTRRPHHESPMDSRERSGPTSSALGKLRRQVPFVFSQVPEQDEEYELDSFCVESTQSTMDSQSPTTQRPKRRRRIHIDSD